MVVTWILPQAIKSQTLLLAARSKHAINLTAAILLITLTTRRWREENETYYGKGRLEIVVSAVIRGVEGWLVFSWRRGEAV